MKEPASLVLDDAVRGECAVGDGRDGSFGGLSEVK